MGFTDPNYWKQSPPPQTGDMNNERYLNQKAILELPGAQAPQELTVADGRISPTRSAIVVDTEGGGAADDLEVINTAVGSGTETLHNGMLITLRAKDPARVVTVKNSAAANGINTADGNDIVLSTAWELTLRLVGGRWYEVPGRASAQAAAAHADAATALERTAPATTTSRGIGRVATAADVAVGSTITNGPAFLDAATWKVSATPAAGVIPLADASGTLASWVDPVSAVSGLARNLKVSATGTNANVSCSADEVIVKNSSNKYLTLRGVSVSASVSSSGAGGLDTGSVATSTWYYVHIIHNPTTSTTALLLSLSSTSPTLPSGYTYWTRVGSIRTGTANSYPMGFTQKGRFASWLVHDSTYYPVMASGTMGAMTSSSTTLVAVSTSAFVPPTATRIRGFMYTYNGGTFLLAAPSSAFTGGYGSVTMQPPVNNHLPGSVTYNLPFDFILESTSIYMTMSGTTGYAYCTGWEDNI